MPALGTIIEKPRYSPVGRFEYYLHLVDVLSYIEQPHLRVLGESLGHSAINLATLAGRLLWSEGVTPDIWRSHDILAVCADAQAYVIALQVICDTMADVIATVNGRRGQTPSDSFHGLLEWAKRNPTRLTPGLKFVANTHSWFEKINGIRTKLVHRGGHVWIYTDRTAFEWDIYVPGAPIRRGKFLLKDLSEMTKSTLEFSDRLAANIRPKGALPGTPAKRVLSGVCVPAIDHLVRAYEPPKASETLRLSAKCLSMCGGYVEACQIGFPDGFWWRLLTKVSELLGDGPITIEIPVNVSGRVHDCKFGFTHMGKTYGIVACDEAKTNDEWLMGATKSAGAFMDSRSMTNVVVAARLLDTTATDVPTGLPLPLMLQDSPERAALKLLKRLLA